MAKTYTGITTLEFLENAKRYNTWIMSQFLPYMSGTTIEIGSGIGNISDFLRHISKLYVSDKDSSLVEILKKKYNGISTIQAILLDITKKIPVSLQQKFESVVAINVLEHIQDDKKALQGMHVLLKKGGKVFILVPAKQDAYTKLDKFLGHERRYEKKELEQKLEYAGFTILSLYYFNPVGLFGWLLRDKFDHDHSHIKYYQVKLFEHLVPILKILHSFWKPPIGISVIAIAEKI